MALPRRHSTESSLVPASPLAELTRLGAELSRALDPWGQLPRLFEETFTPLADVEETDEAYLVELELPGVAKDDIEIYISEGRLTVSGERRERQRVGILRHRTRSVGRFHYEVLLPGPVDEGGVSADLDSGVLTVRVPKPASARPRRIKVA